mgnify:CR=1 FL=1
MTKRAQIRASFAAILERSRLTAVEGPLREQFLADLRELTDAEQDSKELKSAKRKLPVAPLSFAEMADHLRERKLITQMGIQIHSFLTDDQWQQSLPFRKMQ